MQRYSEEFRRDAVALVRTSGRPIAQIARELGINDVTLGTWVNAARKKTAKPAGLPPGQEDAELEENRRLKKRIAELEMEREILKRAVVFWVKESNE
jgi:transposase